MIGLPRRHRSGDVIDRIAAHGRRHRIAVFSIADSIVEWPVVVDTDLRQPCEIGSITKVATGLLAASLDASGRCPLSTPIHEALGLSEPILVEGDVVTIEDLATHHSGLPRLPAALVPADPRNPYRSTRPDDVVQWLVDWSNGHAGGARRTYDYSNFGFAVLGECLGRLSGLSWDDGVDSVLSQLGVDGVRTRWPADVALAPARASRGRPVPHWELGAFAPAGGLVATPTGFAELALRLLGAARDLGDPMHAIVTASIVARRAIGDGASIGLGWHLTQRPGGGTVAWHNGATGGSTAFLALDLPEGRAVGMLASGPPDDDLERSVGSLLDRGRQSVH